MAARRRAGCPRSLSTSPPRSTPAAREDAVEVLMQTAICAGFPIALNALAECHDLLVDACPASAER